MGDGVYERRGMRWVVSWSLAFCGILCFGLFVSLFIKEGRIMRYVEYHLCEGEGLLLQ